MDTWESLNHSVWECKYHVVFIPKCRRKVIYGHVRKDLGGVFRTLAEQKECRVEEGHLLARPRAHAVVVPAEMSGVAGGGLHQGEERDLPVAHVRRTEEEFRRPALLGARILCLDRRARRGR